MMSAKVLIAYVYQKSKSLQKGGGGEHLQLGNFSLPSHFWELSQGDLWPRSPMNASRGAGFFF